MKSVGSTATARRTPEGSTAAPADSEVEADRDRRDSRWDEHRRIRRENLIDATLLAIAAHGAGVGMDEIAAQAGTSKTAFYRHFADRAALHIAVSARVADQLRPRLARAVRPMDGPRVMVAAAIETYLAFVEAEPEVYRFVVHGAAQLPAGRTGSTVDPGANPINGLSDLVSREVTTIIAEALEYEGRGVRAAEPWGHGVVGLVRAAADWWLLADRPVPRGELAAQLTDLIWTGLSGVVPTLLQDQGTAS